MKPISVHVSDRVHEKLKSIAARRGRKISDLIRQAVEEYVDRVRRSSHSILDLPPLDSGSQRETWERSQLFDDMIGA